MLTSFTLWILAASAGLTGAEAPPAPPAWVAAVPADVDVVVHVRPMEATQAEVSAMLKAFSPTLAERAEPALAQGMAGFRQSFGEGSTKAPWVGLLKMGEGGERSFAILVLDGDQQGVLASVNGGKAPELKEEGGLSSFERAADQKTWYTAKGQGYVAFGPDKELMAAVAKADAPASLDLTLVPELVKGDVGVYVNAGPLVKRYGDQIEGARGALMAALDQAGQQAGNAANMEAAKDIYNAMFDALKDADAFVLNADASGKGLAIGGAITAKAGSTAAGAFAKLAAGAGEDLAKLPSDAAYFVYMNIDFSTVNRLLNSNLRMINGDKKAAPEQEAAMAKLASFGRVEALGSAKLAGGLSVLNVTKVTATDPAEYLAASQEVQKSFKGGGVGGLIKEVITEPVAEPFRGIRFAHVVTRIDLDKFAEQNSKNPAAAATMKAMFPGGEMSAWSGTDGKLVYQVTARSWDEARAALSAFLDGKSSIGEAASFKEVRAALPEAATVSALISAQGIVNLAATSIGAAANRPDLKAGELPAEPALLGFAVAPQAPRGVSFRIVVPAAVGPVFEKGLVPLFRALQPPANN
ncbi:hypothetical protein OJF2_03930 [Aquisphaera giovannonii]|uniref:DUF3352 domain-containing protein n=1 Tax=Aquisphaera giovannonii TaxID=406548 RepID=A0A5B9VTS2_9BACT|nr:hypothetical protein [Aquisphaera giovannonii]QEH31926.1 hypothetical protein OJF2_03930 [Aquisphaera giovannonii]